jgi:heme/copper-type cytochrome/quinol oxidase subunit 2
LLADASTTVAWWIGVIAGSIVLLVIALHLYASWTIREIDRNEES